MRLKAISIVILLLCLQVVTVPGRAQNRYRFRTTSTTNAVGRKLAAPVPTPKEIIGFTPGDDRKLAAWSQVVDYFNALAKTSDRVKVQEVGKTTLG